MKNLMIATALLISSSSLFASNKYVMKNSVACTNEQDLSSLQRYYERRDARSFKAILSKGTCFVLRDDTSARILNYNLSAPSLVKIIVEGGKQLDVYVIGTTIQARII